MMSVTVNTVDGFRVEAIHGAHVIPMDEPVESGGSYLGMTPMQSFLGALGACAAITMTMYAKRKGWPLEGAKVTVDLEPGAGATPPRIVQTIHLRGALDEEQRQRLKDVAGKCPVHKIVAGPATMEERLA